MAGLLAIFAEFEREILRERTRAGLAYPRWSPQNRPLMVTSKPAIKSRQGQHH
jgi:DNA invertase Pin-like site-specific DNA recombinase